MMVIYQTIPLEVHVLTENESVFADPVTTLTCSKAMTRKDECRAAADYVSVFTDRPVVFPFDPPLLP